MAEVSAVVSIGLSILGAIASVYLAVGIGLAFLRAQVDTITGRPAGRDIVGRIILLTLCLAFVTFARSVTDDVCALMGGELESVAEVRRAVLNIGQYFLDIIIASVAVLLAVGIATGFVGSQMAALAGESGVMSQVMAKTLAVIGLAVGGLLTVTIAHVIVDAIR